MPPPPSSRSWGEEPVSIGFALAVLLIGTLILCTGMGFSGSLRPLFAYGTGVWVSVVGLYYVFTLVCAWLRLVRAWLR